MQGYLSNSLLPIPQNPNTDSGVYDVGTPRLFGTQQLIGAPKLLQWQEFCLRLWHAHTQLEVTTTDIVIWSELFKLPEHVIRAGLCQLVESQFSPSSSGVQHREGQQLVDASQLLRWQGLCLKSWYAETQPEVTATEIVMWSELFKLPDHLVRTQLYQLAQSQGSANSSGEQHQESQSMDSSRHLSRPAAQTLSIPPPEPTIHRIEHESQTQSNQTNFSIGAGSAFQYAHPPTGIYDHGLDLIPSGIARENASFRNTSQSTSFVSHTRINVPTTTTLRHRSTGALPTTGARPETPTLNSNRRLRGSHGVEMNGSLRRVIAAFIQERAVKGCRPIGSEENLEGKFECTLKCQRRFRSVCDLLRHEATIFPQEFWYCTDCGSLENPSEKHLYTREDKMREHRKKMHGASDSLRRFKVLGVTGRFPLECALCTRRRYIDWKDRCNHMRMHFKKNHVFPKYFGHPDDGSLGNARSHVGDGDNDDDDDNDDNDDNEDSHRRDNNGADDTVDHNGHEGNPPYTSPGDKNNGPGGPSPGNRSDGSPDYDMWLNYGLQTKVVVEPITTTMVSNRKESLSELWITWIRRITRKGGTASLFKVEVSQDGEQFSTYPQSLIVKQYSCQHQPIFKNELTAFEILTARGSDNSHFIRCFGTFVLQNATGAMTYNLLLEEAEGGDLLQFFSENMPPTTPDGRVWVYQQMGGLAAALKAFHNPAPDPSRCEPIALNDGVVMGWHADVKPDNILIVDGKFKLSDFGFSKFVSFGAGEVAETTMYGGTLTYGMLRR